MKKGEIYEGKVTKLAFPNKGIVENISEDGTVETCTVKNVLPGQEIEFRVTKKRHGECDGLLLNVLKKAPNELDNPGCPHFGKCGGCSYQSLSYEDQLAIKEGQVLELLKGSLGNVKENPEIYRGVKKSPNVYGYKNKMEFSFGNETKDVELTLGLHRKGSFYDIVPVPECRIVCDDIRTIINAVYDECKKQKLSFYHKMSHTGLLRHLVVRRSESTKEILVMLVTTSYEQFDIDAITRVLKALKLDGSISGFLHCVNDSAADNVQADELKVIFGKDFFYEELLGLKFKVTPFSFFQTNSKGAEVLYETAREFIMEALITQGLVKNDGDIRENGPVIYDLYSGTGTIAQMLAPVAKKVIGVEIVEEAVESAKINAEGNGLDNCEFLAGDVLKVIDEIDEKPDFIVLDPPRDGIHPKALPKLISYGVDNMIYISCKPTSLQRDLPFFMEAGYSVKKLAMADMFPWTANIETVVCLGKKHVNPKAYAEIGVDAEEYYKIKRDKH